ncbi:2-amino-4-hydroxy-6-hydroxymethyldihydropteridine diphosphokinase [uncultured Muribaculum sp.]|uniref:2-amino-4-hydroxy-6- hydroxymethyldihydropteridine diphosphokinase n=1 Tax=uncultured Muribaculum sp. TaxID=1918613 RepID=UPI00271205BC|nr:2-amino-4-hydroxy-6-hydroxymethyldihydropteridine diphosphokinase [uncultured Muribaculum sp.]
MTAFVVSIGSNVLEHEAMMSRTVKWLEEQFDDVRVSEIYETPEYSRRYDPYFNCVASASTCMSLDDAVKLMKEWEMKCGRSLQSKITGKVVIDLDIVIWNDSVVRPKELSRDYFLRGYRMLFQ